MIHDRRSRRWAIDYEKEALRLKISLLQKESTHAISTEEVADRLIKARNSREGRDNTKFDKG